MAFESAKAFGQGRKDDRRVKRNLLTEQYKGSDILPNEAARSAIKFWIYQRGGLVMDYAVDAVDEMDHIVTLISMYDTWNLTLSDDWTEVIFSENLRYGGPVGGGPISY